MTRSRAFPRRSSSRSCSPDKPSRPDFCRSRSLNHRHWQVADISRGRGTGALSGQSGRATALPWRSPRDPVQVQVTRTCLRDLNSRPALLQVGRSRAGQPPHKSAGIRIECSFLGRLSQSMTVRCVAMVRVAAAVLGRSPPPQSPRPLSGNGGTESLPVARSS